MARMTKQGHGGDVYAASRELHRSIDRLIDFSASINPLGPSPTVWGAIAKVRRALRHYPDPECTDLRQVLALHWRCRPEQIVVGNGSSELIHLLPQALDLHHLLVIGPTFSEYARAMERTGGRVTTVWGDRSEGYAPPLDRAIRLMRAQRRSRKRPAIDAVVLCNPNSPTGQTCSADAVRSLASGAERQGLWLIVDETFAEYCESRSILPLSPASTRVIVLRSLTKFYGLPGLRVGYGVASSDMIQRLRRQQSPWSVNTVAQAAALAALHDRRHAERSLLYMMRERGRFAALLANLPGCVVYPSEANFLLMELPIGWRAGTVTARLRRDGLLIRDCSAVPGLSVRSVRIAVRTRRDNNRLAQALANLLSH